MRPNTLTLAEHLTTQATPADNHQAQTNAHTLDWNELHDPRWERQLHATTLHPQTRLNAAHIITYRTHLHTLHTIRNTPTNQLLNPHTTYNIHTTHTTITNAITTELLARHATQHGHAATTHLKTTNPPHTWALLAAAETH